MNVIPVAPKSGSGVAPALSESDTLSTAPIPGRAGGTGHTIRVAENSSAAVSGGGASAARLYGGSCSEAYTSGSTTPPSQRQRTKPISLANAMKPSPVIVTSVAPPLGPPTGETAAKSDGASSACAT